MKTLKGISIELVVVFFNPKIHTFVHNAKMVDGENFLRKLCMSGFGRRGGIWVFFPDQHGPTTCFKYPRSEQYPHMAPFRHCLLFRETAYTLKHSRSVSTSLFLNDSSTVALTI